jgi:hypothetical protein
MLFVMGIFEVQMGVSETPITMGAERTVQISLFRVTQMIMRLLGHHCSRLPVSSNAKIRSRAS